MFEDEIDGKAIFYKPEGDEHESCSMIGFEDFIFRMKPKILHKLNDEVKYFSGKDFKIVGRHRFTVRAETEVHMFKLDLKRYLPHMQAEFPYIMD